MRFLLLRTALIVMGVSLIIGHALAQGNSWITVYAEPTTESKALFTVYPGMQIPVDEVKETPEGTWSSFAVGKTEYWIPGNQPLQNKPGRTAHGIIDMYGILNQPHHYAVKLVKLPGAKGRLETYEKTENGYLLNNTYDVTYPKEGPKTIYGDLKTVGGPVVRYMYRTMQTGMKGRDEKGREFGAFKVSYPMPHDALPHLLNGHIGVGQYNNIPAINESSGVFAPHPHSLMGADIVIHTARKGSRGCIDVENEAMGVLYYDDLNAENDREIIPLVIYDENVQAPPTGDLF